MLESPIISFIFGAIAGVCATVIYFSKKLQNSAVVSSQNFALNNDVQEKSKKITALETQIGQKISENATLSAKLEQSLADNAKAAEKFNLEFENLANRIFTAKIKDFKDESSQNLSNLLKPFGEQIEGFKKTFTDGNYKQLQEQISLKEEIKRINDTNNEMSKVTQNLTNALKGDSKAQGDWGEYVLETILEQSGLQKDINYYTQHNIKNDAGKDQRPDVVVLLPDNKKIIIDSKVSLTSYERYTTDDENRALHLRDFMKSVESHATGLSNKEYQKSMDGNTLDFVIMFMSIDATFFLAMQTDNGIFNKFLTKNIVIASPTTLIPIIKTIAQMWKIDNQIKNVSEITAKVANMYDKLYNFTTNFERIGNGIGLLSKVYDEAMGQLSTGRGNLIGQVEEIKKMGIIPTKNLEEKSQSLSKIAESVSEVSASKGQTLDMFGNDNQN